MIDHGPIYTVAFVLVFADISIRRDTVFKGKTQKAVLVTVRIVYGRGHRDMLGGELYTRRMVVVHHSVYLQFRGVFHFV